jgi:hypothetical protein
MRSVVVVVATLAVLSLLDGVTVNGQGDATRNAPTIAWACERHPDVLESSQGLCPIDHAPLEPVRILSEWTCPEHQAIAEDLPGQCAICKRTLEPVKALVYWTCPQSQLHEIDPGNCADGESRVEVKRRIGPNAGQALRLNDAR